MKVAVFQGIKKSDGFAVDFKLTIDLEVVSLPMSKLDQNRSLQSNKKYLPKLVCTSLKKFIKSLNRFKKDITLS